MKKLLGIVVLGLFLSGNAYVDNGKVVSYDDVNEMPEKARPNDATIFLFEERRKSYIENINLRLY